MQSQENARTVHEIACGIVAREVYCCVSNLVSRLAELGDEDAADMSAPVADYEEAALQHGWTQGDLGWTHQDHEGDGYETAHEACDADRIDPYEREVFEHWAISQWLARRLDEMGEQVSTDFYGLCVWARTTTGQSIAIDSCVEQIAQKIASGGQS
jgi:hypothetical protein